MKSIAVPEEFKPFIILPYQVGYELAILDSHGEVRYDTGLTEDVIIGLTAETIIPVLEAIMNLEAEI